MVNVLDQSSLFPVTRRLGRGGGNKKEEKNKNHE
jgi:hypothetical protein